jgi:hypothetical protein
MNKETLPSNERNVLDLAKNLQDDLHVYCKGAAGSGDNFYARTFANLADRADELVKLLESAHETEEYQQVATAEQGAIVWKNSPMTLPVGTPLFVKTHTTIRQIAKDPHKALNDLEKEMNLPAGTIISEMLALPPQLKT